MARQPLPPAHYELKLYQKFLREYTIVPREIWRGVRTDVDIYCPIHQTKRSVWLQKVFNGKNSLWPCRQCYLDTLKKETESSCSCGGVCFKRNVLIKSDSPADHPPTENDS